MTPRSHALYSDLLDDLQAELPSDIISKLRNNESVEPWPDITSRQFASLSLCLSSFKKFKDVPTKAADANAMKAFAESNQICKDWCLKLETMMDEFLWGQFNLVVHRFFNPSSTTPLISCIEQIFDSARTGPGASVRAHGNDFYTKLFSGPITASSSGISRIYTSYVNKHHLWTEAEELRRSSFGDIIISASSRIGCVVKNVDISRITATQPTLNMLFQLGIGDVFGERLKQVFNIDLSLQPDKNREAARIGSIDGSIATIDLKDASNRLSYNLNKLIIPPDLFSWLDIFRCKQWVSRENETPIPLHMMSENGNGFTFPLQTIIFACVVKAVYTLKGYDSEPINVFGDDIACRSDCYYMICRLLTIIGATVNTTKSFHEGTFRESCGHDYYNGLNVRGIYIKSLETEESRYVVINRLNEWSGRHMIMLPKTIQRLLKRVRYLPVPLWETDDAGIRVPYSLIDHSLRDTNAQSILYRRRTVSSKQLSITEFKVEGPRGAKPRIFNYHGLVLSLLRGDISSPYGNMRHCKITIRHGCNHYKTRLAIAPNWDVPDTFDITSWVEGKVTMEKLLSSGARKLAIDRWQLGTAIQTNLLGCIPGV